MAKGASPACRFAAASDRPVALFLDVDGTLLHFGERPHEVVTPAGLVAALAKAERKLEGAPAAIDSQSAPHRLNPPKSG